MGLPYLAIATFVKQLTTLASYIIMVTKVTMVKFENNAILSCHLANYIQLTAST